jgi:hypothetical protein
MIKNLSFALALRAIFFGVILALMYIISCNYNKPPMVGVLYTDMEGYYMYLPAIFIYHGFEQVPVRTHEQYSPYPGTNKIFTKYTCGVAILQSPFFLIAHAWQRIFHPDIATGYTVPYARAVTFAGCFYCLLGLFILFYSLLRRCSSLISFVTVIALFTGTNLYYYTICAPGMSHVYSFFLFSLIVYFTPQILAGAGYKLWILYGFIFGLVILTRPTNGILILYPLLYGCYSLSSFTRRLTFFLMHTKQILFSILALLITFIPQMIYWKYSSGHFILYSYNQEAFIYWNKPKILRVLFDVQNGWLLYSPLMILALWGIIIGIRKHKEEALPTMLITIIATYLFASWWAWWYGGAFGHRCYVEFYTLLSFGLATFITRAGQNKYSRIAAAVVIASCIFYAIRLNYIYSPPWDGPNWNWHTFGDALKKII